MKISHLVWIGLVIVLSIGLLPLSGLITPYLGLAQEPLQEQSINRKITRVEAGKSDALWDDFVPQIVEIKAGDSITWNSSSPVAEPHTVTFVKDQNLLAPLAAPFAVSNSTNLQPLILNSNIEPLIVPPMHPQSDGSSSPTATQNKTLTVIINNARATNTVVIDSTGKNIQYLNPNANYTMDGTESYINSGVMVA